MYSGLVFALIGLIGTIIGSVIGCYHSIKRAKWWLPQVFILILIIFCVMYGVFAHPHAHSGDDDMLPVIRLAGVGSAILSLGWLVSLVWLLCHKCWKKTLASFVLWLFVVGLQMIWSLSSLIDGAFQW